MCEFVSWHICRRFPYIKIISFSWLLLWLVRFLVKSFASTDVSLKWVLPSFATLEWQAKPKGPSVQVELVNFIFLSKVDLLAWWITSYYSKKCHFKYTQPNQRNKSALILEGRSYQGNHLLVFLKGSMVLSNSTLDIIFLSAGCGHFPAMASRLRQILAQKN